MSDKLAQSQETSIELSEQDLDAVAGGTGYSKYGGGYGDGIALAAANATGTAFGDDFAVTKNNATTTAISVGDFNLAHGDASSFSAAG